MLFKAKRNFRLSLTPKQSILASVFFFLFLLLQFQIVILNKIILWGLKPLCVVSVCKVAHFLDSEQSGEFEDRWLELIRNSVFFLLCIFGLETRGGQNHGGIMHYGVFLLYSHLKMLTSLFDHHKNSLFTFYGPGDQMNQTAEKEFNLD